MSRTYTTLLGDGAHIRTVNVTSEGVQSSVRGPRGLQSVAGQPAVVVTSPVGIVTSVEWALDGRTDRPGDLPAKLRFHPEEAYLKYVLWYKGGEIHRDAGFAACELGEDGRWVRRARYLQGEKVGDDEHYADSAHVAYTV